MKKVWGLVLGLVLIFNVSYGAMKNTASPEVVCLTSQTASRAIVFNVPARDITIRNQDSTRYVWVDLTSSGNAIGFPVDTVDTGRCSLLAPGEEINLYDFFTPGITISGDNAQFGAAGPASPIIVEALY